MSQLLKHSTITNARSCSACAVQAHTFAEAPFNMIIFQSLLGSELQVNSTHSQSVTQLQRSLVEKWQA